MSKSSLKLRYGVTVYIKERMIQKSTIAASGAQAARFLSNQLSQLTGMSHNDCHSYIDNGNRVQLSMNLNENKEYDVLGTWSTSDHVGDALAPQYSAIKDKKYAPPVAEQLNLFDNVDDDSKDVVFQCPTCSKVLADESSECPDCHHIAVPV